MIHALLLLLAACGSEPRLEGKVVDIWGEPVEGATVMMVGQPERPLTDHEGRYSLPLVSGKHVLKVGRDGYIQDHAEIEIAEGTRAEGPLFRLYRKPEEAGYYLVGSNGYTELQPQTVRNVGNELSAFRGLQSVGDVRGESGAFKAILHTGLKLDQILRLGLQLHELEFVRQAELKGPVGTQKVEVNLYASKREIPISIEPMQSPTDYLITTEQALGPGYYAFQTQGLLEPGDPEAFAQIPVDLRAVHPFELR